ncbi:DUF2855 family protein [Novosphingobium sp.]|uniref:DUF2855 family protein n=1 Tax=Novosphingobium sp. TaxID=1874826 RepID=UPI0025FAB7A5|nr:DUF2855 family protein [Novosphingobium sp.]
MAMLTRLLVKRGAITETRLVERPLPALADGEILAQVGDFALTANNISYALTGDSLGYWQFFPEDAEWGVVPVWGHAEVIESRCAEVPVGTRFWGYLPMASHLVLTPGRANERGFIDAVAHRAALPAVYNQYTRTEQDPPALAAMANARSLLFPLFTTSYLIADYFADNALFGAEQIVIGSASSKTGFATAHFLKTVSPTPRTVIGLTSPGNLAFTEGLGLFDRVIAYDAVASLDPAVPSGYVDMSGDGAVLRAVHEHFTDNLKVSVGVGATHWDAPRPQEALPGAQPAFFFAPAQIAKRDAEWGAGVLMGKANLANIAFVRALGDGLRITEHRGPAAVAARYDDMVFNRTPPTEGLILNFASGV